MLTKRLLSAAVAALLCFAPVTPGNENILRLHVVANSDSIEDQTAKLAVRDAILAYEADIASCGNSGEAKAMLMEDGEALLHIVEDTLRARGMDYGAQLMIGVYDFPERAYGGAVYPAGKYEALRVVLGEGEGHNWWCVMFPPLCILELPGGKIDYEELDADFELSGLKLNSLLLRLLKSIDGGKLWQRIQDMRNSP
ncbi:MAG TPA: stage II sporulation protein R [Clostridia bacterium]|nr:stage II sporulation protein R [Clostridia bacterium]